ncbi:D(3) dopamine receptor [Microtus ochrogaster]|uniref:D(3) dopamine receptor n=1 Tax=Microtus ochrogaster TaxID=79684 RepID=A0ABM1UN16_MICOH|nr:D(3) dopamine receptor [Microtus ochrogaster]
MASGTEVLNSTVSRHQKKFSGDILESHSSIWAMAPLSQISTHINSTCGAENSTGVSRARPHAYYALSYCALILAIIFGNALVCAAVLRERALQTTTNYLVVSLAVADLLVATLVMPWVVYLEVTGGVWNFSRICCDVFVTLDVMMCTASILNLCAISIDRCYYYLHIRIPDNLLESPTARMWPSLCLALQTLWRTHQKESSERLFDLYKDSTWPPPLSRDPSICSISNPDFVIYSSVVSFYVPFGVTVLVYARIYMVLRQRRRKRILTRQNSQCISIRPGFPQQSSCLRLHPIRQFSIRARFLSDATGQMEHIEDKQYPQKCQDPLLSQLQPLSPGQTHGELKRYYSICQDTALRHPGFQEGEGGMSQVERTRNSLSPTMAPKLSLEVRKLSNGRLSTSLKLGPLQPRGVPLREKKATQMVAIVLGAFIVCWLPFFLTHVLITHCQACHVSPALYRATTWLGYVNSALNPVIYTTFNVEFRKAFLKILSC